MKSKMKRRLLTLGIILIGLYMIFMGYVIHNIVHRAAGHIDKYGLKSVAERVWNGKEAEK
jgi:hypothetical protein